MSEFTNCCASLDATSHTGAKVLSTRQLSQTSVTASPTSVAFTTTTDATAAATIVLLLAKQAYHLPGNSWYQDWWRYMVNNHPIFGICCLHKLHPIRACTRIVALVGSLIFGLLLSQVAAKNGGEDGNVNILIDDDW